MEKIREKEILLKRYFTEQLLAILGLKWGFKWFEERFEDYEFETFGTFKESGKVDYLGIQEEIVRNFAESVSDTSLKGLFNKWKWETEDRNSSLFVHRKNVRKISQDDGFKYSPYNSNDSIPGWFRGKYYTFKPDSEFELEDSSEEIRKDVREILELIGEKAFTFFDECVKIGGGRFEKEDVPDNWKSSYLKKNVKSHNLIWEGNREPFFVPTELVPHIKEELLEWKSTEKDLNVKSTSIKNIMNRLPDHPTSMSWKEFEKADLEKIREVLLSLNWQEFENFSGQIFDFLGYSVKETRKSGDAGVDLICNYEDPVGLSYKILIQCKRFSEENKVGIRKIRDFVGSLEGEGADKGIFIVTSDYRHGVRRKVDQKYDNLSLWNGEKLSKIVKNAVE